MDEKIKAHFVDLIYDNIGIICKVCNMYARQSEKKDLQQEIIFQLWKSYPSFKGEAKFQTWMYRVALNTAMLGMRRWKNLHAELNENDPAVSDGSYEEYDNRLQVEQLYHHISKLNSLDKAVIFLYLEQCSYREIAEITGLTEKNVSVKITRIKDKLKTMFNSKTE